MKTKIPLALATGALTLALAACNNDAADDRATGAYGADAPADTLGANDGMAGAADRTAMNDPAGADALDGDALGVDGTPAGMADGTADNVSRDVALALVMAVDQHEIAAAEQARGKELSAEAADYADTLFEDHSRNLEATRALISQAGATDNVPGADDPMVEQMREKHSDERERLGQLDGNEYERAWIEAMVAGHTEALDTLDNQLIPSADEDELRDHLQASRQAIARHLETAQGLRDNAPTAN